MNMSEPLDLENRRTIYSFVEKNPGVYMREIQRGLGMSTGVLEYHLAYLVKKGLLSVYQDGRKKRYYSTRKISAPDKRILAILRQRICRSILIYCISREGASFSELVNSLGVSKSTLSFHISKMLKAGVLLEEGGAEKRYLVSDPEKVSDLIITYKESFLDDLVDRFVESFIEL